MNRNLTTSAAAMLITALLLSASGCCGIMTRIGTPPEGHYPYIGVAADLEMMRRDPCLGHMLAPLGIIDLPFSLVVDTVLLPVDLIHTMRNEEWGEYERTKQLSVSMAGLDTLAVQTGQDVRQVTIRGGDTAECTIEARICGATTPAKFEALVEKMEISAVPVGNRLLVKIAKPRWHQATALNVSLDITIPKRTNLVCAAADSRVEVADMQGAVDLQTRYGSIVCKNITSTDVKAGSKSGAITVAFSRDTPPEISADIQTAGREIRFEAPFEFSGAVEFEATSSHIRNELPVIGHVSRERITGAVGQGRGKLRLKTRDACITVCPFGLSREN